MTDEAVINDFEKTQSLAEERQKIEQALEQVMTNWEELQLLLTEYED